MAFIQELSFLLTEHPAVKNKSTHKVTANLKFIESHTIQMNFAIEGSLEKISGLEVIEGPKKIIHEPNIWKKTCFEFFWAPFSKESPLYFEWNFNPQREWDFFAFSGYRQNTPFAMSDRTGFIENIHSQLNAQAFHLSLLLKTPLFLRSGFTLKDNFSKERFNLAVILDTVENFQRFFSIQHKDIEKPNFHLF